MWYIIKPILFIIWEIIRITWISFIYIIWNIFTLIFFFKLTNYKKLEIGKNEYSALINLDYVENSDKSLKETIIRDYNNWFKKKI